MSAQIGAISSVSALVSKAFKQPKGDFAERLTSRVTVLILALSSALLMSSHFLGDPITCWVPAQFTKQWSDFVNQYCYVHGTYFVASHEQLQFKEEERKKTPVNYYQWVPYILALQALLFYFPRFLWKSFCGIAGYDLNSSIQYVDNFWNSIKDNDASFKTRIASFEGRPSVLLWDGIRLARRRRGRELAYFYALSNVIQTVNAWLQWLILNSILQSPTYTFWGPQVLSDLIYGNDWQKTGHFPRITVCDFERRHLATVQSESVLCVLTLNLYYEKLCLFLWFWLLFVACVSLANTISWSYSLCVFASARQRLRGYLSSSAMPPDARIPSNDHFFRCLGKDGLFILQQMTMNLGDIPTSYLTIGMRNICANWEEDEDDEDESLLIKKSIAKAV